MPEEQIIYKFTAKSITKAMSLAILDMHGMVIQKAEVPLVLYIKGTFILF